MMRIVSVLAVVTLLSGCADKPAEFSGQVFVLNSLGETVRAGGAAVSILDERTATDFAAQIFNSTADLRRAASVNIPTLLAAERSRFRQETNEIPQLRERLHQELEGMRERREFGREYVDKVAQLGNITNADALLLAAGKHEERLIEIEQDARKAKSDYKTEIERQVMALGNAAIRTDAAGEFNGTVPSPGRYAVHITAQTGHLWFIWVTIPNSGKILFSDFNRLWSGTSDQVLHLE